MTTHWIAAKSHPSPARMIGRTELIALVPTAERKAPAPTAAKAQEVFFSVALPGSYFPTFIVVFA